MMCEVKEALGTVSTACSEKSEKIFVWCCPTAVLQDEAVYQRCHRLLEKSEPELTEVVFLQHRTDPDAIACQRFLGKAMLRYSLSQVHPEVAPIQWQLTHRPSGQPNYQGPKGLDGQLSVSLAHTAGMVVCAVSKRPVGIDVEACRRKVRLDALAERYFSASECAYLQHLASWQRVEAFFLLWTLKEAYLKAHGRGIFQLTHDICFDVAVPQQLQYVGREMPTNQVQLETFRHPSGYRISLVSLGRKITADTLVWSFQTFPEEI